MDVFLYRQILDPFSFFDHGSADGTFDQIGGNADRKEGNDGQTCEPAQAISQRNAHTPDKAAVEEEGDHGLTAGAEGEVGGIGVGIEGHHKCRHPRRSSCRRGR